MSTKCLVTTLKGTVNNNNLPLFGKVDIIMNNTIDSLYSISFAGTGKYKIISGTGYAANGTTPLPNEGDINIKIHVKVGESVTVRIDKYNLTSLTSGGWNPGTAFSLNDLNYSPLTVFRCNGGISAVGNITGTIESFVETQSTFREVNDIISEFRCQSQKIKLNNTNVLSSWQPMVITFNENTVDISGNGSPLATYTKSTGEWHYEDRF